MDQAEFNPGHPEGQSRHLVAALFSESEQAQAAVKDLKAHGFRSSEIDVAECEVPELPVDVEATRQPVLGGTASGALAGILVGTVFGLFLALGAYVIPEIRGILPGGVVGTTLIGASVGAAAGGVLFGLIGLGMPKPLAALSREGFVVAVNGSERDEDAKTVLIHNGGDLGPGNLAMSTDKAHLP